MALQLTEEGTGREVKTPSGTIHYYEAGEGYPLIFLHGSGPGATGWSNFGRNMAVLGEQFRCIAPDMPGWGRSDAVKYADRDHPKALGELMDALGIDKAAVLGNSMGGATTLRFATNNHDRVSHLATMGAGVAGLKVSLPAGPSEGLKVLYQGYRDPSPEQMMRLVQIMTFDDAFATEDLARQRSDMASSRQDHLDNFIEGMGGPRPGTASEADIAQLPMPALIIHGRDDRVVHYENGLRLVSLIKNSRLLLLNQCGHWAQLEHADVFNRAVADFVKNG